MLPVRQELVYSLQSTVATTRAGGWVGTGDAGYVRRALRIESQSRLVALGEENLFLTHTTAVTKTTEVVILATCLRSSSHQSYYEPGTPGRLPGTSSIPRAARGHILWTEFKYGNSCIPSHRPATPQGHDRLQ